MFGILCESFSVNYNICSMQYGILQLPPKIAKIDFYAEYRVQLTADNAISDYNSYYKNDLFALLLCIQIIYRAKTFKGLFM